MHAELQKKQINQQKGTEEIICILKYRGSK